MMKRSYLLIALVFGITSNLGFAQTAYVVGNDKVQVNQNTLLYFGDGLTITNGATDASVISNDGNVEIVGNYQNNGDTDGKNFVSTWTAENNFGQVIIHDDNAATGWLTMEKRAMDSDVDSWGQFAVPYAYSTPNDAMQNWFGTTYNNGTRYRSSMMLWDNLQLPEFDHLTSASAFSPVGYYILNLTYSDANIKDFMDDYRDDGLNVQYNGMPTNGTHSGTWDAVYAGFGTGWDSWKNSINSHNERYYTYIDDFVREIEEPDYGKYIYQFGNPYTSNMDLTKSNITDYAIRGVMQSLVADWTEEVGSGEGMSAASDYHIATYQGGVWGGDAAALIVKPFNPFIFVLNSDAGGTFDFNDGIKTFNMNPSANVIGKNGNSAFYQLEMNLTLDGIPTSNRFFVIASSNVENGERESFEAEYFNFGNRTGFYLAQEHPEGEHVTYTDRKMHINAINTDFVGKPIPLFFSALEGDNNTYVLTAKLFEGSIFNKLSEGNYSDENTFLFYDQKTDTLLPIASDFEYTIEPQDPQGARIRYEIYWNEGPEDRLGTGELTESRTIIYRDQDLHKIRFNEKWNSADVKVYDISGRSIQSYTNVSTKTDKELKLPANGVYVVKIVADNGDVYTQKIIK